MQATRRLISFLVPYRKWVFLAPLMMLVEISMDLLQPRMVQAIIDQGVATRNISVVSRYGAEMVGFALIGLLGGVGCTVYAVLAAQGVGADLRHALFAKVQRLSFASLDRWETGSLITRLTNDVSQIQEIVMIILRVMVRAPLLLVGSLIMGVITSPRLALIFVVLIPLLLGFIYWIIERTYPIFGKVQARLDKLNGVMQENLAGVRVVKAFDRAEHEKRRFGVANEALAEQAISAARIGSLTMPVVMFAMNVGVVVALWNGGKMVGYGDLSVGKLIAFINYLTQALMAVMMTSMLVVRLSRAEASSVRVDELLRTDSGMEDPTSPLVLPDPQGRVEFDHVSFSYGEQTEEPVLADISFVAEAGKTLAIVGSTGSGKSSLVNLIPRFYDATSGRVLIDGVDVRELSQDAVRKVAVIALQETQLFSGTVRDNIRYGGEDADDEQVARAAADAQAAEFIQRLPEGYDARVEQRGANFSGGQRQRLSIARALLPEPKVLILDDSTSAVDVRTESLITDVLRKRPGTKIIVAQRISAVQNADKILVLEGGRLVAEGTHSELLEASQVYREIYESQIGSGTVDGFEA